MDLLSSLSSRDCAYESSAKFCRTPPNSAVLHQILFELVPTVSLIRTGLYSYVHDQLPPPLLARAPNFQIRYAHPTSLDCHQPYKVIVAKPYAWLQEPCFCSVVIFVNIMRFPPVRHCQISSAIAETALYSCFGRA